MRKLKFFLFLLSLCLLPCLGWSATYTVCASGCDQTTIQAVFDGVDLAPDDIVEVRADAPGGTKSFNETVTWGTNDDGSVDHPVTLRGRSGDTIIIDGQDTRTINLNTNGNAYLTITNLTIQNAATSTGGGFQLTGDNLIVTGCTVKDNANQGIMLWGSSNVTISGNTITGNGTDGVTMMEGCSNVTITGNTFSTNDDASVMSYYVESAQYAVTNLTVSNNTFTTCGGYGISAGKANGVLIENNIVNGAGKTRAAQNGIGVLQCAGSIIIRYNSVTDVDLFSGSADAIGIIIDSSSSNAQVYYNKVSFTDGVGIAVYEASGATIYNNSVHSAGQSEAMAARASFSVDGTGSTGSIWKNNISSSPGIRHFSVAAAGTSGFTSNYNVYDSDTGTKFGWSGTDYNFADWKTQNSQDANSPAPGDPLFVSATDLHLKEASPCRATGTPLGFIRDYAGKSVPFGGAPDIGAYQYEPTPRRNWWIQ